MNNNAVMLKQLKTSLKGLKEAEKIQNKLMDEMIVQLPEDKKKDAIKLINKAKKGKININELMNFASGVRDIDKDELEKTVKEGVKRVKKKKKEVKTSK